MPFRFSRPRITAVLLFSWLGVRSNISSAQDKTACLGAHVESQELRRDGKLLAAKEKLVACASDVCPSLVRADCTKWLDDVGEALPSVVFDIRDSNGQPVDAEVFIDDQLRRHLARGKAIDLDPGPHRVRFRAPDGRVIDDNIQLGEGDRLRRVTATFTTVPIVTKPSPVGHSDVKPLGSDTSPRANAGISPFAFVSGGVAVLALGGFVAFGLVGRGQQNELEKCAPYCSLGDVGDMRRSYATADISLAVAAVATITTGVLVYVGLSGKPSMDRKATSIHRPRSLGSMSFEVVPRIHSPALSRQNPGTPRGVGASLEFEGRL